MVQTVSVGHHDRTRMRDYTADEIAEALRIQRGAFLRDGPPTAAVRQNRIDRLAALTFDVTNLDIRSGKGREEVLDKVFHGNAERFLAEIGSPG